MKRMNILVSVATRNRPSMLCELLDSLCEITKPDHVTVDILVVENNHSETLSDCLAHYRGRATGGKIVYLLETEIGISFARNRALSYALDGGYDLLVFVDDDERVELDWLERLLTEQQRCGFDIVGSPVRPSDGDAPLTLWQRIVLAGIREIQNHAEARCRRQRAKGCAGTIKLATGSWMGKVDFFRRTCLKFDPRFGLTGGEDWHLWAKAKTLGAKTGWAPDAIVYETVPPCRLTLAYHFRRTRDHNATEFLAAYRNDPKRTVRRLPWRLLGRFGKLLLSVVLMPARGSRGLVSAAMAFGSVVGLMQGSAGRQFQRYVETTGY